MNRLDDMTNRLLRAAARSPHENPGEIPNALLGRIVRQWRETQEDSSGVDFLLFLRKVAAYACSLSLLLIAVSLFAQRQQAANEWSIAGTVTQLALER